MLLTILMAGLSAGQDKPAKDNVLLRKTIETYPEDKRRPILDYLDGARIVADKVALNFATQRDVELDGDFSRLARDRGQKIFVREYVNMVRDVYGPVTSYEFRGQALEASAENPDVNDLQRARSAMYYAIRTAKRPEGELFLIIRTIRIGNAHAAAYLGIKDYRRNVPSWLHQE
ncbi:MAG TPA: hypothetical protein VFY40_04065 [Blastocatellia bacterium]|nr:hypothetical protein [Blastocatellia bacterium]